MTRRYDTYCPRCGARLFGKMDSYPPVEDTYIFSIERPCTDCGNMFMLTATAEKSFLYKNPKALLDNVAVSDVVE